MGRWVRALIVIVVCVFSLAATRPAGAEPLKVGHDLWIGYSGVFIAQAKGFFKEEGVEVELTSFSGPGDSLPPLIAGHLDMNLTTLHNLALVAGTEAAKADLKVVYLIDSSHGADAVVAKKAIADVSGLHGKRIGVTLNEANHLFLMLALASAGLSESDVELVNLSADDAGGAFVAGAVDAAVTWEPWVTKAMSEGGGHVVFSTKDAPDLIINAIVAPQRTRASRAKEVAAFIRAVDRGVSYLAEHPQESHAIVAKALGSTPDDVVGMLAGDRIYDLEANRELLAADGAAVKAMAQVVAFLRERKLIEKAVDPASLLTKEFAP